MNRRFDIPVRGFTIAKLLRSSACLQVYEARRDHDQRPAIAKVYAIDDALTRARVAEQLGPLQALELAGVLRPLEFECSEGRLVVVFEASPGVDLDQLSSPGPLSVEAFLPIALSITATLAGAHEQGILHHDLRPATIRHDPSTGRTYLGEFGIDVLLEHERRSLREPAELAAVVPYLAPEHSGRYRREVDLRSDLYALGATFYKLLSGRPPFLAESSFALRQAHLNRVPRSLAGVPRVLARIVAKLVEKRPYQRYLSSAALLADLERFANAYASGEHAPEFELGVDDRPPALMFPGRLYGREPQLRTLGQELANVVGTGGPRVVVVHGPEGIGRTALLEAFEAGVAGSEGLFGLARFGPGGPPFAALLEALAVVAEQLEAHSVAERARWQAHLRERVGAVAAVVVELLPGFAPVFGELEPVPELEPDAARLRHELGLARLLSAIAERVPLVLALDDVQDADVDSFALLEAIVARGAQVLVLLGCTDAGLDAGQGPALLCERLSASGHAPLRLGLGPLGRADIVEFVDDVFACSPSQINRVDILVKLVERVARGVPGRVRRCVEVLDERGLIGPSPIGWTWDLQTLEHAPLELDAATRLSHASARLEPGDVELLELAAWIGAHFDPALLLRASGRGGDELAAGLTRLTRAGLIAPLGLELRFRRGVRAATLASVGQARADRCLAVAEALDAGGASDLAVASALGLGVEEQETFAQLSTAQRARLGSRCAAAGRAALHRGAWFAAREHLARARALAGPEPQSASLVCDHAVALALAGQREAADSVFEGLLERPLSLEVYALVVARRVRSLALQGRHALAVALGVNAMARCGMDVDQRGPLATKLALGRAWLACRKLELDALRCAGPIPDPRVAAASEIAAATIDSAATQDPRLHRILAAVWAERVARSGLHRTTPLALTELAVAVAPTLLWTQEAARLCDLAVELCAHVEHGEAARPRIERAGKLLVWPRSRSLSVCVAGLVHAQRRAVEIGDMQLAGRVAGDGLGLSFHAGVALIELQTLGRRWREDFEGRGRCESRIGLDAWLGIVGALVNPRRDAEALVSDDALAQAGVAPATRAGLAFNAALASWLLGEHQAAAARLEPFVDQLDRASLNSCQTPTGAVMLAILTSTEAEAKLETDDPNAVTTARAGVRRALRIARRFARSSWANYGAHVELIQAELEQLRGRTDRAFAAYERARELADDVDNFGMKGLICTRLASLALARGRRATARGAAVTAISVLRRWGAELAARHLELEYAELLAIIVPTARAVASPSRAPAALTNDGPRPAIDAATVLGVMHLISEELQLEEVVTRVIVSAVSSAGAERGVLLLEHEGVISLVAEGDGVDIDEFVADPVPLVEAGARVPRTIIEQTLASGAVIVIDDARTDLRFAGDPYLQATELCSLLCMPITRNFDRVGVLLLENRVASGAFPTERVEVLRILLTQAASALRHARLYEALQRSEVLFRSLVDGVPDMISLMDLGGRIEFINHLGDFAAAPAAFKGVDSRLMMDPSCGPQWREALEHVATTGEQRQLEVRANFSDGQPRWFMVRLGALAFGGKIGKLISISTDITERKLAEVDKLRLEAQLRQQQRLESVGTLASGVAHEINNPIQGIMNYADLIVGRAGDVALVTEFANEILTESERVASIVRNLLAFSRQEIERQPEACAVVHVVDATLSLIRAVVRKDEIELRLDLPDDLYAIHCRYQQIQQVIMNLVANARDALNERHAQDGASKIIDIRARNLARDGRRWVRISVQDCGTGIPEHVRAQIFDPFFTTKGRDQGTGLGLAVSHGIAADHGGELWVESEVGVGTSFHLDLPAVG